MLSQLQFSHLHQPPRYLHHFPRLLLLLFISKSIAGVRLSRNAIVMGARERQHARTANKCPCERDYNQLQKSKFIFILKILTLIIRLSN